MAKLAWQRLSGGPGLTEKSRSIVVDSEFDYAASPRLLRVAELCTASLVPSCRVAGALGALDSETSVCLTKGLPAPPPGP